MKVILGLLLLFSIGLSAHANCTVNDITIGVVLSFKTNRAAYANDNPVELSGEDHAYVIINGEKTTFEMGTYEEDQRGNSAIKAISKEKATYFELDYDHETWHEGLWGFITTPDQKIIDLKIFKECDSDMLFTYK